MILLLLWIPREGTIAVIFSKFYKNLKKRIWNCRLFVTQYYSILDRNFCIYEYLLVILEHIMAVFFSMADKIDPNGYTSRSRYMGF